MRTRIKELRKSLKLNQTEFGEKIGATTDMISNYETGRVVPDLSKRMLICEKFGVRREWLEDGKLPKYAEQVPGKPESLVPALMEVLHDQPALLSALTKIVDRMDASDWKALNAIVEKALDTKKDPEA